jgi:hypothetical protein
MKKTIRPSLLSLVLLCLAATSLSVPIPGGPKSLYTIPGQQRSPGQPKTDALARLELDTEPREAYSGLKKGGEEVPQEQLSAGTRTSASNGKNESNSQQMIAKRFLQHSFEEQLSSNGQRSQSQIESRAEQGQYSQCSYMCLYCTSYARCIQCDRRFYLYNGYCQAYQTSSSISWFWILVAILCCGGCVLVAIKCNSAQEEQPEANYQQAGLEMQMHNPGQVGNPNMINGYVPPQPLNNYEYQYNPAYDPARSLPPGMMPDPSQRPNFPKRDAYAQEYGITVTPFEHQPAPLPPNFLDIDPQLNFDMSKKDQPANLADDSGHKGTNYPKRPSVPPKANPVVSALFDEKTEPKNKVDANKFLFDSVVIDEKPKDEKKDDKSQPPTKDDKETKKMKESLLI